jgi:hypothetical protein
MITNLPKQFNIKLLDEFSFGQPDAKEDDLLEKCLCHIAPFEEFMKGGKDIILGERGTGKSALFRLIKNGEYQFKPSGANVKQSSKRQIIIPIDEELNFISIKDLVSQKISGDSFDLETKFRICWEIFLLIRIVIVLRKEFSASEEIHTIFSSLNEAFDLEVKTQTLFGHIFDQKKTIGIKIDNLQTGFATPNFYVSVEPSANFTSNEKTKTIVFSLEEYKSEINRLLQSRKCVCYVLIDKLDEFVVKEEYEAQKKAIQGLLHCQRGFLNYQNLKLRLFLRTDLFYKLNFESLGFDKIKSKTIELKWPPEDIRQFIARRVIYNLLSHDGMRKIEISLDEENLSSGFSAMTRKYPKTSNYLRRSPVAQFLYKGILFIEKRTKRIDARDSREINLNDALSRCIIRTIFPSAVDHNTIHNKRIREDLFTYLESHFSLGTGNTTPRIILMFLEKSLENTRRYFYSNPDIKFVDLDKNNELPLVKRDCMYQAYNDLKVDVWETCCNISNRWRELMEELRAKKGIFHKKGVSYQEIISLLSKVCPNEEELREFLAFLVHVGVLNCSNSKIDYKNRTYNLPILFK